jgi:hypothetical protein
MKLKFNGCTSDWFPVTNGIRQGNPLSIILYIIYSSDLVDIATSCTGREVLREMTLTFVDYTAFIVIANDFNETHTILTDILEYPEGNYEWSKAHDVFLDR